MANRLNVDANRLFGALTFLAIVMLLAGFATVGGGDLAIFSVAAVVGAIGGGIVAAVRSEHGLGASRTSERMSPSGGTINFASIRVAGVGGLGLLVLSAAIAWMLPGGPRLVIWGAVGGAVGAAALITWRHFHSGSPFIETPGETLHLR